MNTRHCFSFLIALCIGIISQSYTMYKVSRLFYLVQKAKIQSSSKYFSTTANTQRRMPIKLETPEDVTFFKKQIKDELQKCNILASKHLIQKHIQKAELGAYMLWNRITWEKPISNYFGTLQMNDTLKADKTKKRLEELKQKVEDDQKILDRYECTALELLSKEKEVMAKKRALHSELLDPEVREIYREDIQEWENDLTEVTDSIKILINRYRTKKTELLVHDILARE